MGLAVGCQRTVICSWIGQNGPLVHYDDSVLIFCTRFIPQLELNALVADVVECPRKMSDFSRFKPPLRNKKTGVRSTTCMYAVISGEILQGLNENSYF